MTQLSFFKYQGAGNDFILLDNRAGDIRLSEDEIARLCHRRFGIGADGLMLLEAAPDADFRMVYFNADGRESSMCGNGGRCIAAFAKRLGIVEEDASFHASDGRHEARIERDGTVSLHMNDVHSISHEQGRALLDTGSPHCILWVENLNDAEVVEEGRRIRHEAQFAPGGVNVNFVHRDSDDALSVRTYERGVEDETLSCGTGVTAAAIAASVNAVGSFSYDINTPGGRLQVMFEKDSSGSARKVMLRGPAVFVFEGTIGLR